MDKNKIDNTVAEQMSEAPIEPKKPSRFVKVIPWLLVAVAIIIGAAIGCSIWYKTQLMPVNARADQLKPITIASGSAPRQIGELLEQEDVIRSATAFSIYARISGKQGMLQAGTYRLSPAETVPEIMDHLIKGSVDKFNITFLPGATLENISNAPETRRSDIRTALLRAGYSDTEIDAAFEKQYDHHPVFKDKPNGADLEGYVYGETYSFNRDATVEDVLTRSFDELWAVIQEHDLINKFAAQGLNLYEGITLASIIQRETNNPEDQRQVAQVFYSRLGIDMVLGSDVTYQYIADKTGVERDTNLASPYNTRRYAGLPPGPIASPGFNALIATAEPAEGDYLYFVSGDDGVMYFSSTLEGHDANVRNYCVIGCSSL